MLVKNGQTDVTTYFVLRDTTNHAPSLSVSLTDIDLYYAEEGAALSSKADATALAAADSAHGDNQAFHVGRGLYRIDWPDAAFDVGVGKKVILIVTSSGTDDTYLEVELSPAVDVAALSGDSTAADNLESQFDGTGLTGGTYPSTQSQVSAIGTGTGAALNFAVDADNASTPIKSVSSVGTQTGTFANTLANDGTAHQIASVANAINWVYGFSCGTARTASRVSLRANMDAVGDTVTVSAYNFVTTNWDARSSITGTTETLYDIPLLAAHTGTSGADIGKVYIRFVFSEADAGTLVIDEAYVEAQQSGSLVGYSDGAVWLNTNASNTNTVPYVDGVADNPVSTIAAALSLAVALSLKRIRVANGSSITLAAAVEAYSLVGKNWTLALGGQSISGSYIEGATVTGTGTGATAPIFVDCHIVGSSAAPTLPPSTFYRCGVNTTVTYPLTAGSAGQFLFVDCFSEVAGSGTPYFTFAGANGINIRRWSGGTNITLNNTNAALSVEVLTGGGQTIAVGGADVEIRGICRAVTLTGITSDTTAQIDAVTGPISLAGADGTVNIYGVNSAVTDNRTGAPALSNLALSQANPVGSVTGAVGSVTGNVGGNVAGSVASVTAPVTAGTVSDKTGYALSNTGIDALFTRQLTESYAADGAAPTVAQALMLIQQTLTEFGIVATTLTVKKLDGSTTAATFTLDDATDPTSITRAT